MPSIPFTSSDFVLIAASFTTPTTIVAEFTYPPDTGISGYSLTVDGDAVTITDGVSGPDSNQVTLTVPLQPSNRLAVLSVDANVTTSGVPVTPGSIAFYTPNLGYTPNFNDAASDILRRFLPPVYRYKTGWEALIGALGTGDETVKANAQAAFDQLFLSSAIGNYLVQRAADEGIVFPENAGLSEEVFRKLAIVLSNSRQTAPSLLGILEAFYGYDATHARLESAVGPFALVDGDSLTFQVDDRKTVTVYFRSVEFDNIAVATPTEVAAAISRAFRDAKSTAFANAQTVDGQEKVVVYSGSPGLLGSLEVTDGIANKVLQFPTRYLFSATLPLWTINRESLNEFRFTWQRSYAPGNLNEIEIGDYVCIDAANAPALRGSYRVTDVHINADTGTGSYMANTWFSIQPPLDFPLAVGHPPLPPLVTTIGEIVFYRPTRKTVAQNENPAYIAQHQPLVGVDVILPATTQAITRAYNEAAYLHASSEVEILTVERTIVAGPVLLPYESIGMDRILVTTNGNHNFTVGQTISLMDVQGTNSGRWEVTGPVTSTPTADTFYITTDRQSITVPAPPATETGTGGFAYAMTAPAGDSFGPYLLDSIGLSVTGTATTSTEVIARNRGIPSLGVASASSFPDSEGWIVIGFGTSYEAGPIKYLGTFDNNNLVIDRSFVFQKEIPSGATVTLLASKGPFGEGIGEKTFILVDSAAGRVAAEGYIDDSKAVGVELKKYVIYPGDRGLGGEGEPITGLNISDVVGIWASDNMDQAVEAAHNA